MDELVCAVTALPHTAELLGTRIEIGGTTLRFEAGEGAGTTRRMLRDLAYAACGMPIVNYLSAREQGIPLTAIPVFLTRRFPQGMLICDRHRIERATDLEGKRVGVAYYGNTDATWVRGMLAELGVRLDRVT